MCLLRHGWLPPLALLLSASTAHALPSVGVLPLDAAPSDAERATATTAIVEALKQTHAFQRVVSPAEMAGLVADVHAHTLNQCLDAPCVQQVTGVIGGDLALLDVQYVVTASLAQSGAVRLLALKLVNLRSATMDATVSQSVCAPVDEAWQGSVRYAVDVLLKNAKLPVSVGKAARCGEAAMVQSSAPVEKTGSAGPSIVLRAGLGMGSAGLVTTVMSVLFVAMGLGAFAALSVGPLVAALPTPGLTRTPRFVALRVPPSLLLGAGAAAGGLAVAMLVAGGMLAAVGWLRAD